MFLGRTVLKSFLLFTFIYTSETEIDESKLIKEYETLIKDSSSSCNLRVASFILHQVLNTLSCKDKDLNAYGQWCIKESELKDIILKTTNKLNNDELKKFVVSCFSKIHKDQDKVKDGNLKQGLIGINCRAIPFYKDDLKQCFKEEEISQQTLEKIKQELKQQNENKKKLKKGKKTGSFGEVSKILFDNLFVEDLLNKAFESLLNVGKPIYDQIIDKAKIIRSQPPEQPTEPRVTDESEAKKALSKSTQEPQTTPESDTSPGNKNDEGENLAIQNPPLSTQVDVKKGALNTSPSSATKTPEVFDRSHSSSGNSLLSEQIETPQNTNSQEGGLFGSINSFFSQKNKLDTGNTISISGQGLERENVGSIGSAETGSLPPVQERKVLEKDSKTESDLETPTHASMGAYLMDELKNLQAIIINSSELDELIKRLNSKAQDTENQNPDKGSQQLIGNIHSNASLHNREIEEETGSSDAQGSTSGDFVEGAINKNPPKEPGDSQNEPTALKDIEDDIDAIQKAQTQESKLNRLKNIFSSLSSPIINASKYMLLDLPTNIVKKTFKEPKHAAEQTLQPPESSDKKNNSSESSEETLPLEPKQTKLQEIMETKYEFLNLDQKLLIEYDEQFIKFNENSPVDADKIKKILTQTSTYFLNIPTPILNYQSQEFHAKFKNNYERFINYTTEELIINLIYSFEKMISYGNTLAHYLNKKTYDEFSNEIRTENSEIISYGFNFYAAYIDFYQCYHLLAPNLAIFKNIVNNKYENNYNGKFLNLKFLNAVQISLIYKVVELIKLGEDSSKQFEASKAKFALEFEQRENDLKELQKTNEQLQKEIESEKLTIDSLENTDLALLTKKIQSFNDLFVETIKSKSPEENKEFFNLLNDFVKAKENLSKLSQAQIDKLIKKEPETKAPELREITQWTEPEAEFTLPQLISDWNSVKNSLQTKQPSLLTPKLTALFKKFEEFSKDKKEVIDIVMDDKSVLSTREDQYTLVKKVANNNNEPVVKD